MQECLSHESLRQLLAAELTPPDERAFDEHISNCTHCQQRLDQMSDDSILADLRTIRRRVQETSLEHHQGLEDLLHSLRENPPQPNDSAPDECREQFNFPIPPSLDAPMGSVGKYAVVDELGRGATSIVFKAIDRSLGRTVALKVLQPVLAVTPSQRSRFEREARALAGLSHPNIVSVFAVEAPSDFPPYLVMEFLDGPSLAHELASKLPFTPERSAAIAVQLADALAAAHKRGLVHRDVKPSNVLCFNGTDRVKLADFGLIHAVQQSDAAITVEGSILGTPEYMSPEQIAAPKNVDARADIYSVGAVLYQLITGAAPFAGVPRMVIEQAINDDPLPPRRRNDRIPRDLETICLKCLEKEPTRRYQTAENLADDLRRFLRHEPVEARRAGYLHRLWRWSIVNRPLALMIAVAIGILLLGTTVATVLALVAAAGWTEARRLHETSESRREEAESRQYCLQIAEADRAYRERRLEEIGVALAGVPIEHRSWEYHRLDFESSFFPHVTKVLSHHNWEIVAADLDASRSKVVSAGADGQLLLSDLSTGKLLRSFAQGKWDPVRRRYCHSSDLTDRSIARYPSDVEWNPDGRHAIAACLDGSAVRYDSDTGQEVVLFRDDEPLCAVGVDSTGSRVLFAGISGSLYLWHENGSPMREEKVSDKPITKIVWDSLGHRWIAAGSDGTVRLLAGDDLRVTHEIHGAAPVWDMDVDLDDHATRLAVAPNSPEVLLYDLPKDSQSASLTNRLSVPLRRTGIGAAHAVCLGKDGQSVYGITDELQLVSWSRSTGQILWTVRYAWPVQSLRQNIHSSIPDTFPDRFSRLAGGLLSSSHGLVTAGHDMAIKCWDMHVPNNVRQLRVSSPSYVAFDPSNRSILWAGDSLGNLSCIDCEAAEVAAVRPSAHTEQITAICSRVNSTEVVTSSRDGHLRFWRFENGLIRETAPPIRHVRPLLSTDLSNSRKWIAALDSQSQVIIWDSVSRTIVFQDPIAQSGSEDAIQGRIAFSSDGLRLAAFGNSQFNSIYTTNPFRRLPNSVRVAGSATTAIAWLADPPNHLVAADNAGRIVEVAAQNEARQVPNALTNAFVDSPCMSIAATLDNRRLFLLDRRGRFTVYDPKQRRVLLERESKHHGARQVAVDNLGRRLVVAHDDGLIQFWDTEIPHEHTQQLPRAKRKRQWQTTTLLHNVPAMRCDPTRMVQVDQSGRVIIAYFTHCAVDQPEPTGNLLVTSEFGRTAWTDPISDRAQFHPSSCCLTLITSGPAIAFRRKLQSPDPYDGDLVLVRQQPDHTWEQQVVAERQNSGFFPVFVYHRDRPLDIMHFDFDECQWLRTFQDKDLWQAQPVGLHGDGFALLGTMRSNVSHFIFTPQRFNSDPSPPQYMRWEHGLCVREVIDPAVTCATAISTTARGDPIAFVLKRAKNGEQDQALALRDSSGWHLHPVPAQWTSLRKSIVCDSRGRIHLAGQDPKANDIVHWIMDKNEWQAEIVDGVQTRTCDWVVIRLDQQERPVVLVCFTENDRSDVSVYRPLTDPR